MMVSSYLIKYGNEIAKDTFRVPVWVYWLILAACPLAFIIIGTQLMALAWRACGKTIADQQWTKGCVLDSDCGNHPLDSCCYRRLHTV